MAEILFQESLQHFNLSLFGNDKSNVRATTKTKQENGKNKGNKDMDPYPVIIVNAFYLQIIAVKDV